MKTLSLNLNMIAKSLFPFRITHHNKASKNTAVADLTDIEIKAFTGNFLAGAHGMINPALLRRRKK